MRTQTARTTTALAGVAGALLLAGCSGAADGASNDGASNKGASDSGASDVTYADGTYTAEGTYQTPETIETIQVTLTVADGTVSAVEVTGDPQAPQTEQFQGQFIGGISDVVVGKGLDEITVDRVAGSSLTSGGFNQAVAAIRDQAAE